MTRVHSAGQRTGFIPTALAVLALMGRLRLLKGTGKIDGDGWKDTTQVGEVVFAYPRSLPKPYAPDQYERVGNMGWTASARQYDFRRASLREIIQQLPVMWSDLSDFRAYSFRWETYERGGQHD